MSSNDEALIAQLQEAHGRATKGEWTHHPSSADGFGPKILMLKGCFGGGSDHSEEDAALIVLCHNALPRLIYLARIGLASMEKAK